MTIKNNIEEVLNIEYKPDTVIEKNMTIESFMQKNKILGVKN